MSITTKFKHAVEAWLRTIVADEVSRINTDLDNERAALCFTIKVCDAHVNAAVDRLNELSFFKENAALREHLNELRAQITTINDLFKKLHPSVT